MVFEKQYELDKFEYIGHGKNGKVYLMPDGRVIKICKMEYACRSEYEVLKAAEGSPYFPRVYEKVGKAIIRDYVGGEVLPSYIRKHGLSRTLAINLINLIEEFRRLNFKRLDIRGAHIYVKEDESIMVIDPASQTTWKEHYPKLLLRELRRQKVSKKFYQILREERPDLYKMWKR
jgi:RIO-like serine/threonine protein kinase fused to N-terminal HTH domain